MSLLSSSSRSSFFLASSFSRSFLRNQVRYASSSPSTVSLQRLKDKVCVVTGGGAGIGLGIVGILFYSLLSFLFANFSLEKKGNMLLKELKW